MYDNILIAHFESDVSAQLAEWCRSHGVRDVRTAADGAETLRVVQEWAPDLVLLSALLPKVNGFEVCQRWSRGTNDLPVLLLTDAEDPYVRARSRFAGARRLIAGDISQEQLTEILETDWRGIDPLEVSSDDLPEPSQQRFLDDLAKPDGSEMRDATDFLTDSLTGLVKPESFTLRLEDELNRTQRYGNPLSYLLMEISNHESLMQRFGAEAGDEAILEVAGVLLCCSRDVDVAGRVGDTRFGLLMPHTDAVGAEVVENRLIELLAEKTLVYDAEEVPLEMSVVTLTAGGDQVIPNVTAMEREAARLLAIVKQDGAALDRS